jgi:hypothetical protein
LQCLDGYGLHLLEFGLDDHVLFGQLAKSDDELSQRRLEGIRLLLVSTGPLGGRAGR